MWSTLNGDAGRPQVRFHWSASPRLCPGRFSEAKVGRLSNFGEWLSCLSANEGGGRLGSGGGSNSPPTGPILALGWRLVDAIHPSTVCKTSERQNIDSAMYCRYVHTPKSDDERNENNTDELQIRWHSTSVGRIGYPCQIQFVRELVWEMEGCQIDNSVFNHSHIPTIHRAMGTLWQEDIVLRR